MISKEIRLVPAKQTETDFTCDDLNQAPNSFFLSISVVDVLETSPESNVIDIVCDKIRKGGKILVNGVDGLEVCRQVYYGQISLPDASESFFRNINNLHSIVTLKQYFLDKGWDIKFAGLDQGRYLIEAHKPC